MVQGEGKDDDCSETQALYLHPAVGGNLAALARRNWQRLPCHQRLATRHTAGSRIYAATPIKPQR